MLLFMTGEVCGDVGVRLFAVVTLSVAFAGVAFHPSTCINFIFFWGDFSFAFAFVNP